MPRSQSPTAPGSDAPSSRHIRLWDGPAPAGSLSGALPQSVPTIVLVDSQDDLREVLRIVLERRGWRVWDARDARTAQQMVRQRRPQVAVFDVESAGDAPNVAGLERIAGAQGTRLIILGHDPRFLPQLPSTRVLAKPYHFRPLIRTIEDMVGPQAKAA